MTKSMERAKITKIFNALKTLPQERIYRILLRYETLQPVGLITKREFLNDSSIGRSRDWALGLTFSGEIFREPLDMINPRTNELKSCIIRDNGFFVVTARVSDDPGNEDENFQWYASPDQMKTWHEIDEQIKIKADTLSELKENLENLTVEKNHYFDEAHRLGSHNRNLTVQVKRLAAEISRQNTKMTLMETMVANTAEYRTELMSMFIESLKTAGDKGKMRAMTTDQLIMVAVEEMKKRERAMVSLQSRSSDNDKSGGELVSIDKRVTDLERNNTTSTPQPPPTISEEEKS